MSLTNSNFAAARQRLHADPAVAELPVTAGLLLVPALHVGGSADGFAIGNLGRFQGDVHAIALLQPADGDFDVLLAGSGDQEFLGLRIAIEAQGKIFFQQFVQRVAHAVFVVAALRFDREGDGGLGQFDRRESDRRGLVGQRVAGERVRSLATAPMSPGMQFVDRQDRLAERDADMGQAFRGVCAWRLAGWRRSSRQPESTLKKVIRPANGSAVVLKT